MPIRKGGRYAADDKGNRTRVEGTEAPADGRFGPRDAGGRPLDAAPATTADPAAAGKPARKEK